MKVVCKRVTDGGMGEYEYLSKGKCYYVFLVHSSVVFDKEKNDHVHKSTFLVFNDANKWREYPTELFEPLQNQS